VLGNLDTAPTSVRQAAARLMRATRAYGIGQEEDESEEDSSEDDDDDGSSSSSDGSDEMQEEEEEAAGVKVEVAGAGQHDKDDEDDDGFDARAEALLHGEPGPLPRLPSPLGSGGRCDVASAPPPPAAPAAKRKQTPAVHPRRPRRRPAVVNICFAYTSTDELRSAVLDVRSALRRLQLLPGDVDARLLLAAMHTRECPPVDLVLRTSGEQRLSDFVVWQAACAQVQVLPCLWPEITFPRLARCVAGWQRNAAALRRLRAAVAAGGGAPDQGWGVGGMGGVGAEGGGEEEDDDAAAAAAATGAAAGYHAFGLPMGAATLFGVGSGEAGGGGNDGGAAAAAAAPGGGIPAQRAASMLSSISEDEPTLAPHPHVALRVAGFLRSLDARRGAWVARYTK